MTSTLFCRLTQLRETLISYNFEPRSSIENLFFAAQCYFSGHGKNDANSCEIINTSALRFRQGVEVAA